MTAAQRLGDLAGPDVATRTDDASVAVLPLGSIEHHGPHLPLSTDLTIVDAYATALAAEATVDVWLLPSLGVTKSDEHAWAPGTLWLSAQTLLAVLDDIGRSLTTSPLRRLVLLNGHGGNSALLQVAARDLRRRHGLATFVMHPHSPVDQGGPGSAGEELGMGVHGGRGETSMMLHLRPDLVRMDLARRSVPEHLAELRHVGFGKPVSFGWLSDDFGTGGVVGDPTGASAEEGKAAFEAAVTGGIEAFAEISTFTPR